MKNLLLLALSLVLFSCNEPKKENISPITGDNIIICNEGNFTYGNASVTVYTPSTDKVVNQAFMAINGFPVGDVLQSGTVVDGRLFLAVNNSGKVLVSDAKTLKYLGTIKGLTSPRYALSVGGNSLYISDLYSDKIAIADVTTFEIKGYIKVGNSTEQMVLHKGYVYACSWRNNNQLYKIDTRTNTVVDSIAVGDQPNSIVLDRTGSLWVLSEGAYSQTTWAKISAGALTKVSTETFKATLTMKLSDMNASPSELTINGAGDQLYFINSSWGAQVASGGIYKLPITATELPAIPYIAENGRTFYALGVNPVNEDIYVSDAVDFAQRGTVYRYNKQTELITSFKADIIPGAFCFI